MGGSGGVGRVRYDQKLKSKSKQGIDEGISIRHEDANALHRWPVEVLHSASRPTQGILCSGNIKSSVRFEKAILTLCPHCT